MQLKALLKTLSATALLLGASIAHAEKVHVAVAANFTAAMKEIAADFEKSSGHKTLVSYGSTGKLYAQIQHGAPFEVFLAADQKRPQMLVEKGTASKPFTYAIGKLVLWSSDENRTADEQALKNGNFKRLAISNPKTAPYGAAALEILANLGVDEALKPKLVVGDNLAQTHQFIATGNAEYGFIALAQIALDASGSRWLVPENLYAPIQQDAVLLTKGKDNPAALALLEYLKGDAAKAVIQKYGYGTE
jgi:molybdate transport system substrate-binding protein